jgi:putative mRNA 3-end processing factor
LLTPEDELVAICLTHAHLDHYQSLETCRRNQTTIYASPSTAALLPEIFEVAAREYDVTTTDATSQAIEPLDGWTTVAPGIAIYPLPAGHAPGAASLLFRFDDGNDQHHVLATGDFTTRRAAGYPGFKAPPTLDIDVLFLTAATSDTFSEQLTEALGHALQRAHSGAQTLVTTSGLVGVHVAYLLDAVRSELDLGVTIHLAGQVAKLYDTLEYDCQHVTSIPQFADPQTCLQRGTITIAGPEVPRERSSGRLFGRIREDPSACVVQLISSSEDPVTGGQCTIHDYKIANHPTRDTLEAVHDNIVGQTAYL